MMLIVGGVSFLVFFLGGLFRVSAWAYVELYHITTSFGEEITEFGDFILRPLEMVFLGNSMK